MWKIYYQRASCGIPAYDIFKPLHAYVQTHLRVGRTHRRPVRDKRARLNAVAIHVSRQTPGRKTFLPSGGDVISLQNCDGKCEFTVNQNLRCYEPRAAPHG